eukprot:10508559-Karenia_brevis.AAC.1
MPVSAPSSSKSSQTAHKPAAAATNMNDAAMLVGLFGDGDDDGPKNSGSEQAHADMKSADAGGKPLAGIIMEGKPSKSKDRQKDKEKKGEHEQTETKKKEEGNKSDENTDAPLHSSAENDPKTGNNDEPADEMDPKTGNNAGLADEDMAPIAG